MNKYSGKSRRKIKVSIEALEYQSGKFGLNEAERARLEELKNSLTLKK